MNIEKSVDSAAYIENAGGLYYLTFPYQSLIGNEPEALSVRVPIKSEQPSAADKKALVEAITLQGGLGRWTHKDDGSIWLVPAG